MKYRSVGASGLKVSEISLGGWLTFGGSVDTDASAEILQAAVDGGINFIDLADVYAKGRAEEAFGAFLRTCTAGGARRRGDFVISSKVFWPMSDDPNDRGLSRKHIIESCERSLKRLGTDYLDLYFCHRFDTATPVEETVRAMDDLIRQGKVLYWGTSVWGADQLRAGAAAADRRNVDRPIVEQPRYNLLDRTIEREVVPACEELGMGLVVWSPLAQGLLTGKYSTGVPEGSRGARTDWLKEHLTELNLERVRRMRGMADELGCTTGQLALAWALHRPGVASVITGATSVAQVHENLGASAVTLDPSQVEALTALFP